MKKVHAILIKLPLLINYLLVGGLILFITSLFPLQLKFNYEFDKGRSWQYKNLEAPFDFAIQKADSVLAQERAEIESRLSPFYTFDAGIMPVQLALFDSTFEKQLADSRSNLLLQDVVRRSSEYKLLGRNFLTSLFSQGIIELKQEHTAKGKDFVVWILNGNVSSRQTVENLLNISAAKGLITDSLPKTGLEVPDFLLPLMQAAVVANVLFDSTNTYKYREQELQGISNTYGLVKKGDIIVSTGEIVQGETYQKLQSFQKQFENQAEISNSRWEIFVGYFLITALVLLGFVVYLGAYFKEISRSFKKTVFILMWPALYCYLAYLSKKLGIESAYLIPFAIAPVVVQVFFDEKLAFFTHIVVVTLATLILSLGFEFMFLQTVAGLAILLGGVNIKSWSHFFSSMVYLFVAYCIAFLGWSLIEEGAMGAIDWSYIRLFFLNVLLSLLAYPLIPLLERVFGFLSPITLLELSDMNRPLLQELGLKAPGTLQHSMQVANLAEAAAQKIGANSLLVKVGALYHDVGKTTNPEYFIENQSGDNPHEAKIPVESAKIIIGHVEEGVKLAKKHRLPEAMINFIKSHHGNTRVEYFYQAFLKESPDGLADSTPFTYPGPVPVTKEETVLMLADSVEAACKSLKSPSGRDLDNLIDKIVGSKITKNQLDQSDLSFRDLQTCKEVFKKILRSVYHVRIEYPEEGKSKGES